MRGMFIEQITIFYNTEEISLGRFIVRNNNIFVRKH